MLNNDKIGIMQEHYDHFYEMVLGREIGIIPFLEQIYSLGDKINTYKYYAGLMQEDFISKDEGGHMIDKIMGRDFFKKRA